MELAEIREQIDEVDEELLALFLRRMALAEAAAAYKREHGLPILNRRREEEILAWARERSGELERYSRCFFTELFELARARQAELIFPSAAAAESVRSSAPLRRETANLVLIGMPGSGKSTVGRSLAAFTGREVVDLDQRVETLAGISIPEIFERDGEEGFRALERTVTEEAGTVSGAILVTGGGVVKDARNYAPLHRNGRIYHLLRDLSAIPAQGRPLSQGADLAVMWAERAPLYAAFRDVTVDNNGTVEATVQAIWRDFCEHIGE